MTGAMEAISDPHLMPSSESRKVESDECEFLYAMVPGTWSSLAGF